jgi:hypothetical protein
MRFHDLAGSIRGPVVHRNHFIIAVVQFEQLGQALRDGFLFVARGHDDRNSGSARNRTAGSRIPIPLRRGDVGHARHPDRCIHDARKPGQREYDACNPMKVMHPGLGLLLLWSFVLDLRRRFVRFEPWAQISSRRTVWQKRPGHGDDRQDESGLQRPFIRHITHHRGRRHIAQNVNDENVYRERGGANVRIDRVDHRRVQAARY